jgi:crescentin
MSLLSDLLGRGPTTPTPKHEKANGGTPDNAPDDTSHGNAAMGETRAAGVVPVSMIAPVDEGGFSAIASRMGEENENLRSLLLEVERKIEELDDLKRVFAGLAEPIGRTLRTLEEEKAQTMTLRTTLNETRSAYERLRADAFEKEHRATALEIENDRLREDLELALQNVRSLEMARTELSNEASSKRAQLVNLERQLAQESAQRSALAEDVRTLSAQAAVADKRIVQLESDADSLRQKLAMTEDEKRSLQKALEQSSAENSRLSRRLNESESALSGARVRLGQIEGQLVDTETERKRLASTLEEAIEQHRAELANLTARNESLQSRSATSEKLLAEARQTLVARTEEVREFDRKAVEATVARSAAEKKLRQLENAHDTQERQISELTQQRAALSERVNTLTKTLKSRELALARAEEQIQMIAGRASDLEHELQAHRNAVEQQIEELNAALQRERMDRAVSEGALEASRKDFARLQREMASIQTALRRGMPISPANVATVVTAVRAAGSVSPAATRGAPTTASRPTTEGTAVTPQPSPASADVLAAFAPDHADLTATRQGTAASQMTAHADDEGETARRAMRVSAHSATNGTAHRTKGDVPAADG